MQHFISNSPWSGRKMIEQVQQNISEHPEDSRRGVDFG